VGKSAEHDASGDTPRRFARGRGAEPLDRGPVGRQVTEAVTDLRAKVTRAMTGTETPRSRHETPRDEPRLSRRESSFELSDARDESHRVDWSRAVLQDDEHAEYVTHANLCRRPCRIYASGGGVVTGTSSSATARASSSTSCASRASSTSRRAARA
jgi:hypothetical protein